MSLTFPEYLQRKALAGASEFVLLLSLSQQSDKHHHSVDALLESVADFVHASGSIESETQFALLGCRNAHDTDHSQLRGTKLWLGELKTQV